MVRRPAFLWKKLKRYQDLFYVAINSNSGFPCIDYFYKLLLAVFIQRVQFNDNSVHLWIITEHWLSRSFTERQYRHITVLLLFV